MTTVTEITKDEVLRRERASKQSELIDDIIKAQDLKNDASLARLLEVSPPVISKLRNGHLPIGAGILMSIMETTGRSTVDMKRFLGMRIAGDPRPEQVA